MPYLRLLDARDFEPREFQAAEVRIGRDPGLEYPVIGGEDGVVSARHCRFVYRARRWWIEDRGSLNGTYLNEKRLGSGKAAEVTPGCVIGLGKSGPRFKVEAAASRPLERTIAEEEERAESGTEPTGPLVRIRLFEPSAASHIEARGARLRIGRSSECELRPVNGDVEAVSRVHAEIAVGTNGFAAISDAASINGTFVNEEAVLGERELANGDRIRLGVEGPLLIVESLTPIATEDSGEVAVALGARHPASRAADSNPDLGSRAPDETAASASSGATPEPVGSADAKDATVRIPTLVVRKLAAEMNRANAIKLRRLAWSLVLTLGIVFATLSYRSAQRDGATAELLDQQRLAVEEQRRVNAAQRAAVDSMSRAAVLEYEALRDRLERAVAASAPASVIDSLGVALSEATERTRALESALVRAQTSLNRQLALGDSLQKKAAEDVERLRTELARARAESVPKQLVDSLRAAVREAEEKVAGIGSQMRAVSGVNLAALARENQGATGLVTAYKRTSVYDGSGFAITGSGYFVTNRHVVLPDGVADSVFVTMADEKSMLRADVIAVAPLLGPDLAVLKVRNFSGPHVSRVDWSGARVSQGEPAALIGFPAGVSAALDATRTVRTSMSAGIFSKVTADRIQFDGFSVAGSSGSPVFNADGEVVGVHRGSLRGVTGMGFAVPVPLLVEFLPGEAKRELGL